MVQKLDISQKSFTTVSPQSIHRTFLIRNGVKKFPDDPMMMNMVYGRVNVMFTVE